MKKENRKQKKMPVKFREQFADEVPEDEDPPVRTQRKHTRRDHQKPTFKDGFWE